MEPVEPIWRQMTEDLHDTVMIICGTVLLVVGLVGWFDTRDWAFGQWMGVAGIILLVGWGIRQRQAPSRKRS